MKSKNTSFLIAFLVVACTKENSIKQQANIESNIAVATSVVNIPVNDLGTGTFNGYTGGLYPGGLNSPTGTHAADLLAASNSIIPIDSFGNPSSTKGKILFISLGGSTGGQNMKLLIFKTTGNPKTNPKLILRSCNNGQGLASLNSIMNPNDIYWDHVTRVIKGAKASYRQVQVIYLETDDSTKSVNWPGRATLIKNDLKTCLRVFKQKFPNIKVVYVLGRTRTFGKLATHNTEPSPYYFGWGCKWAIEDQINGVPGTEYKGPNAVAPMITWGFYQWADTMPRITDGFKWSQNMVNPDGLHPTPRGQDTLTTRFQKFLLKDQYARIWYAAP